MATTHAKCPHPDCDADIEITVEYEGGDIVPYGSTTARLPGGYIAVDWEDCPDGHLKQMPEQDQQAWADRAIDNYEPDYDGPDREDDDD